MKKKTSTLKTYIVCFIVAFVFTCFRLMILHETDHMYLDNCISTYIRQIQNDVDYAVEQVYALQILVEGADGKEDVVLDVLPLLQREKVNRVAKCIALAPNGVIDKVFPLEGNESLLGMELPESEYQEMQEMLDDQMDGRLDISHMLRLPDGTDMIIGCITVYLPGENGLYEEWGSVAIGVDFPELLSNQMEDVLKENGYNYRILRKDETSGTYTELLNNGFTESFHILSRDFRLEEMEMRIEAVPKGGWISRTEMVLFFLQNFVVFLVLAVAAVFIFYKLKRMWKSSVTDGLTGLWNRTKGQKKIEAILHSKNFKKGYFILLDIDNFKQVNDTLGHQKGDEVLINCARVFKRLFRKEDTACRLGGDEFIVFVSTDEGVSDMDNRVERLLQQMYRDITEGDKTVQVSVSIGIALAPEHGITFNELYKKADEALYTSKKNGRNQATVYEERY